VTAGAGNSSWDFTCGDGMTFFFYATKGLDSKKYDGGDPAGLRGFLGDTQRRGMSYGWMGILNVPTDKGDRIMTSVYGSIKMSDIESQATSFMATDCRNKQASEMLITFLHASLDNKTLMKLQQHKDEYTFKIGQDQVEVGSAMLLKLIQLITTETWATTVNIEDKLGDL